jgi:flavorubredoxin
MKPRKICEDVYWVGAVDWNRKLFDALIPLPDGTSYNAYLVQGSEKTALIDTVDPAMAEVLLGKLETVEKIDYIISQHSEQDHSGTIPIILERNPESIILCSSKAKNLLIDHLEIPEDRIKIVENGETISLGNKTLQFIYTPWVHWPETMVTFLPEDKILFTCDFFGSHMAMSDLFAGQDPNILEAAKRYYAEIMMPYRKMVKKNLDTISALDFNFIAPSHGPIYDFPEIIISEHEKWASDQVSNHVVIPYISMHGSTEIMVNYLVDALAERGIKVQKFELTNTDIGKLAMSLVDAATLIVGSPTLNVGPHPHVLAATILINMLRPKLKNVGIVGSYGWSSKAVDQITDSLSNIKADYFDPIIWKGHPQEETFSMLDQLADQIQIKHSQLSM